MTGKYFLDTNFLVYLFTKNEMDKQNICQNILKEYDNKIHFVLSTQVFKEFTAVMINKFDMPPLVIKSIFDILEEFEVVNTNTELIKNALDIHILNKLSFWDSLIVSAAKSANCSVILSEDMNDGQVIDGIRIQSPFTLDLNA